MPSMVLAPGNGGIAVEHSKLSPVPMAGSTHLGQEQDAHATSSHMKPNKILPKQRRWG